MAAGHVSENTFYMSDSTRPMIGQFSGPYSARLLIRHSLESFFLSFMLHKLVKQFESCKQLFQKF